MPTHVHIGFAQGVITFFWVILILMILRAVEVFGGKSGNPFFQSVAKAVAFIH